MNIDYLRELAIKKRASLASLYVDDKDTHVLPFDIVFPEISSTLDNDFSVYRFAPNPNINIHRSKYEKPVGMYFAPSLYMGYTWAKTLYREREDERSSISNWKLHKYTLDKDTTVSFRLDLADIWEKGKWEHFNRMGKYNIREFNNPYIPLFYAFSELVVSSNDLDKLTYQESIKIDIKDMK